MGASAKVNNPWGLRKENPLVQFLNFCNFSACCHNRIVDSSNSKTATPIWTLSFPDETQKPAAPSPKHTPTSKHSPRTPREDNASMANLSLPPPKSSGSESSGYFTPSPPDSHKPAFIKMDTEECLSFDAEEPQQVETPVNSNSRDVVDSFSIKSDGFLKSPNSEKANSSFDESHDGLGEPINDNFASEDLEESNAPEYPEPRPPSKTSLVLTEIKTCATELKRKSKSVVELQSFLPEINPSRKSINSAPPRNEDSLNNIFVDVITETYEKIMSPPFIIKPSYSQAVDEDVANQNPPITLKLERRLTRQRSKKTVKASPRAAPVVAKNTPSNPKEILQQALSQLENPNWETTLQGLHGLSKLAKQHPEVIEGQMHQVCITLAKHIKNLRSQVARIACGTASELFAYCKRGLEMELEELAGPLLQRTADTNKFLRADANSALDVMCEHLPSHRVISVMTSRGCNHQNSIVRAASVRLLGDMVQRLGPERVFQLPKELREKLLLAGANSLTDGNLETRSFGKAMFRHLVGHSSFQRHLHEAVPQNTLRHISKVLASIKS